MKQLTNVLLTVVAAALIWPASVLATGPRVTSALFSDHGNEIHTVDFPPFASSEVIDGGMLSEVVRLALKKAAVDAVIITHPVQRMVRYYLMQEDAMAVMGRHMQFTDEEKKDLIFISLTVMEEKYFYYKPAHPQGLSLESTGERPLIYGSHRGEDVSRYKNRGMSVKYGRTMALLKKLKSGEVDFIAVPPITVEWLLDRYMHAEKDNFTAMHKAAGTEAFYIIFNRKHADGEASAGKFRKALAEMVRDGTYKQIVEKHLGNSDTGKIYLRRLETFQ